MNEPVQRDSSSLQTEGAQFHALFFGDAKAAAMKVVGG